MRRGFKTTKRFNASGVLSEHEEQKSFFERCRKYEGRYPLLKLILAIPNGGFRSKTTAVKMKAEGVKAGFPDVLITVARKGYHGMTIEFKATKGGKLRESQQWWIDQLTEQGYYATVAYGADDGWTKTCTYLDIPMT